MTASFSDFGESLLALLKSQHAVTSAIAELLMEKGIFTKEEFETKAGQIRKTMFPDSIEHPKD